MAKIRLKIFRNIKNSSRTIEDCYKEYMDYCKSIGQRPATIASKERFYKYELLKMISVEEKI